MADLPIIELLKQNFRITPNDSDADIRGKIQRGTEALGADVETTVPYLLPPLAVRSRVAHPRRRRRRLRAPYF